LHPGAIDIVPAEDHGRSPAPMALAVFDQRGKRGSTGAFRTVMGSAVENADCFGCRPSALVGQNGLIV
jgi:hypothetical protein